MKICIIKLGASGDVVRTLPIAEAIKNKYPDSEITWITKENSLKLLEGNHNINKATLTSSEINEEFDILYNFDIDEEATSLASKIEAKEKYGFYSEGGYPVAFNFEAEYYLNTLFDDELKKTNKKTYQEMMFNTAKIDYSKKIPKLYLTEKDVQYAENFLKENNLQRGKILGLQIGASPRWPSKSWPLSKSVEFIKEAKSKGYDILILNGPDEEEKIEDLRKILDENSIKVYLNNPDTSIKEFASIISLCERVVCPDSLALHLSLALGKKTVALFFCTTPHEVEGYGLLNKIVSPIFYDFFPERQDEYNEDLINSISVNDVLNVIENDN